MSLKLRYRDESTAPLFALSSIKVGAVIHGRRVRKIFGRGLDDHGQHKEQVTNRYDHVYDADGIDNYYSCTAESFGRWVRCRTREKHPRQKRRR